MGGEVDSQLSHTFKIVYFTELDNGLSLAVYTKIFTLDPDWILEAPHSNFTNIDIASYNLYKLSCLGSRVILR